MGDLNLFIPLTKIDAEKRLVYGVATAETLDRSGEICDYASTKPFYEKWSSGIAKATGGKSLGNLRAMHGKIAAGKLVDIAFNDDAKQIEVAAKVVDDDEWKKVEEGVYTGFSHGGRYVKKWTGTDGAKRYTAEPSELSLVDYPCVPEAVFEVVKADGVETRHFVAKAEVDEKTLIERTWKIGKEQHVKDWDTAKELAKAQLVEEGLRKAEIDVGAVETPVDTADDAEKSFSPAQARGADGKWVSGGSTVASRAAEAAGRTAVAATRRASAIAAGASAGIHEGLKAGDSDTGVVRGAISGAITAAIPGAVVGAVTGGIPGAITGAVTEGAIGALTGAIAGGSVGAITGSEDADEKTKDKRKSEKWVDGVEHKTFWTCGCEGHEHVTKLEAVACAKDRLAKEAAAEMPEVSAARDALGKLQDALGVEKKAEEEAPTAAAKEDLEKMLGEEVWDAAAAIRAVDMLFSIRSKEAAEPDNEAAQVASLDRAIAGVKEFIASEIMEDNSDDGDGLFAAAKATLTKIGARNSAKDLAALQAIHDHCADLGAKCSGMEDDTAKAAETEGLSKIAAENGVLKSELQSVTSRVAELTKAVEALREMPAPAKAAVFSVSKSADGGAEGGSAEDAYLKKLESLPPDQRAQAIMKLALRAPVPVVR